MSNWMSWTTSTRLPDLEAKRKRVTDEIETLEEDLETAREELEKSSVDVEERREEQSELEERREDVTDELTDLRTRIDQIEEAFEAVRELSAAGCDVVAPVDTTTSERGLAEKGPSNFSDDIRNEVGIATLATVPTASADKVNTLVATGRADLCAVQGAPSRDE